MPESFAPLRTTRAAMFAAVCVALAAVGHSFMSGMNVPFAGLLAAFGVTGLLAWLGAGRRRGPLGITAALLAVQGALHLVFSGSQVARHAPAGPAGHHHHLPGMVMPEWPMPEMAAEAPAMAGTHDMTGVHDMAGMADVAGLAGHGGLAMIGAHVLAGVFCAIWLAWGEAAVFRLAGALGAAALLAARPLSRALALVRTHVAAVPPRPVFRRTHVRPRRLRGAVHAHTAVRRGPPGRRDTRATAPGLPARA